MTHTSSILLNLMMLLLISFMSCQQNRAQDTGDIVVKKKKLLEYLESLPSKNNNKLISGQQVGHGNQTDEYYNELISDLHVKTGSGGD